MLVPDVYILLQVLTTCDDHGISVSKDQSEVIEFAWLLVESQNFQIINKYQTLVKPTNTPITPLCTSLTNLSWDNVRNAGTFKDAVIKFDSVVKEHLIDKGLSFVFIAFNSWDLKVQVPREARDKNTILPTYLQYPKVFDLKLEYQKWQAHHPEAMAYSSNNMLNVCNALTIDLIKLTALIQAENSLEAIASGNSTTASSAAGADGDSPNNNNNNNSNNDNIGNNDDSSSHGNNNTTNILNNNNSTGTANNNNIGFYLPKRAIEHVYVFREILAQLVRKSRPFNEHKDVLSRPFDLGFDIKTFLIEKSKVLYMNNLPYDTTQSELESWFTRFGGRPIAFRTLQTPDPHKVLGSGFAIFATHESAAESLAMNGRSLNDRSIEVQPSSFKLLDFAQEILIPFPLSKNRSRPGDWTCPSCGFSNFQRRTACFRCSFPATSAAAVHESLFIANGNGNGNGNNNNGNAAHANVSGGGILHDVNKVVAGFDGLAALTGNGMHHNNHNTLNSSINNSNNNNNINNNNTNNNSNNNNSNNNNQFLSGRLLNNHHGNNKAYNNGGSNNIPFRAGDWKCENCTYHNFAKNLYCLRCGITRINQNGLSRGNNNGHNHGNNNNHHHQHNQPQHNQHNQQQQQQQQQQHHLMGNAGMNISNNSSKENFPLNLNGHFNNLGNGLKGYGNVTANGNGNGTNNMYQNYGGVTNLNNNSSNNNINSSNNGNSAAAIYASQLPLSGSNTPISNNFFQHQHQHQHQHQAQGSAQAVTAPGQPNALLTQQFLNRNNTGNSSHNNNNNNNNNSNGNGSSIVGGGSNNCGVYMLPPNNINGNINGNGSNSSFHQNQQLTMNGTGSSSVSQFTNYSYNASNNNNGSQQQQHLPPSLMGTAHSQGPNSLASSFNEGINGEDYLSKLSSSMNGLTLRSNNNNNSDVNASFNANGNGNGSGKPISMSAVNATINNAINNINNNMNGGINNNNNNNNNKQQQQH